jgi:hypothetical protein
MRGIFENLYQQIPGGKHCAQPGEYLQDSAVAENTES